MCLIRESNGKEEKCYFRLKRHYTLGLCNLGIFFCLTPSIIVFKLTKKPFLVGSCKMKIGCKVLLKVMRKMEKKVL